MTDLLVLFVAVSTPIIYAAAAYMMGFKVFKSIMLGKE